MRLILSPIGEGRTRSSPLGTTPATVRRPTYLWAAVLRRGHRQHVYVVRRVVSGGRHGGGVVPRQVQTAGGPQELLDLRRYHGRMVLHGERQRVQVTVRAGRARASGARGAVRGGGRVQRAGRGPDAAMELQVRWRGHGQRSFLALARKTLRQRTAQARTCWNDSRNVNIG